jgi:subfamily B ATP-binding cassette protein HlyB/CyaB
LAGVAVIEERRDSEARAFAERLGSGLAALSLIAAYFRIAADPAQLRHQLALAGRLAGAEDLVHWSGATLADSRDWRAS